MPNFLKDKKKPEGSTFEKPNAIFLDENNLESCDDENNKPLEGVSSSEIKPKTKPAEIVEKEDCSVLGLNENIILTETIEESDVSESEASQKKLQHLTVLENCEVVVYGCGWNGGENIDFATTGIKSNM
uniref:Uncharacterized protein n=1 Tax=Panagrolaimus sp. ES5 TaxID=591445 RepID=A0AC34G8N1_9BILA